jgi:hypothetical protein
VDAYEPRGRWWPSRICGTPRWRLKGGERGLDGVYCIRWATGAFGLTIDSDSLHEGLRVLFRAVWRRW